MNTTLTSIINDVYTLTNRPDLVGETLLAVRNSTLKAHRTDFYPKDFVETGITFDYAQSQQVLEYKTLVPRWRALKYIRKFYGDTTQGCPGEFLTVITPEEVLDSYSVNREDVCYLAGMDLKIRTREKLTHFLLGCYINPDVTPENYCSWIADEQPAAILYDAAATIFKTIGFDEQNAAYQNLISAEYSLLKQNILATGY